MSLFEEIKQMQEEFISNAPDEVLKIMQEATQKLQDSGLALKSLKEGDKMPYFTLPNAQGKMISSQTLLKNGPLVINFYRGGWCPYCNLELQAFADAYTDVKNLGAELVSISPNVPEQSLVSIEQHSLGFEVLSDKSNLLAKQCNLVYELDHSLRPLYKEFGIDIPAFNADNSFTLPIPATYVVDRDGIIKMAFVDADYTKRLEPSEVITALRGL